MKTAESLAPFTRVLKDGPGCVNCAARGGINGVRVPLRTSEVGTTSDLTRLWCFFLCQLTTGTLKAASSSNGNTRFRGYLAYMAHVRARTHQTDGLSPSEGQ